MKQKTTKNVTKPSTEQKKPVSKLQRTVQTILTERNTWILFGLILLIGLFLRFYTIEDMLSFGWDQGRDAYLAKDVLDGKWPLIGPRTGIGHMHLGPLYFYLLAPFYALTNLDPMASNYLNILLNIVNFVILFYVTKKLFGNGTALFVTLIYATSSYLIILNRTPWNVTLMPGIAALIFFSLVKVNEGAYRWVFAAWTLAGLFFHIHFTAIFLPPIILASLLFVKDKGTVLKYSLLSIPLYLVWYIPNIFHEVLAGGDRFKYQDFLKHYFIGLHFRFLLHRLNDAFIQFQSLLAYNLPILTYLKFIIPAVFTGLILFEKDKNWRLLAYLVALWFLIPLLGFTLYGGPLSDYYFLFQIFPVFIVIIYLQQRFLRWNFRIAFVILCFIWIGFIIHNAKSYWIKPSTRVLAEQKAYVRQEIEAGHSIEYREGSIESYLYGIWTDKR